MTNPIFGNDRPLLYTVEPWRSLGFAVPNWGNNVGTLSNPIAGLVDEVGKMQLFVMTHIDAQRTQPPSRNTLERLCKMTNRIYSVLSSRMRMYNEIRLEEGHASADQKPFIIHPVPYFNGSVCRNRWLAEYNQLTMVALCNMMQHSDNNLSLTITSAFAKDVWKYFQEVQRLIGTELLMLTPDVVLADGFLFSEAHYESYDPEVVTINFEGLDTPGVISSRATEDDLRPLFRGYPATLLTTSVAQYAIGDEDLGLQGAPLPEEAVAEGTKEDQVAAPGGGIGKPQI